MPRSDQVAIPAAYVRGGSSKALFFHEHDLPPEGSLRDRVLKRVMGTPDPIQIDGMGGTKAITSKIAIVRPSIRSDADIDYTFAQCGVRDDTIAYDANCGNISSGVGPFAIDEGLVKHFKIGRSLDPKLRSQEVRIYNTGTQKHLIAHVPIDSSGTSVATGYFTMAAVPGTGAPILMDYRETTGAARGKGLLPTGNIIDKITIGDKVVQITIGDAGNIVVLANAKDFGITNLETAANLTSDAGIIGQMKELRGKGAQLLGMCRDWELVDEQSPFMPMVAVVGPPMSHGQKDHLSARLFLDNMCHESISATAAICIAACSRVVGSVIFNQVGQKVSLEDELRIAHPLGTMPVSVDTLENLHHTPVPRFGTLSFVRTSRRLMDGVVYVPKDVFDEDSHPVDISRNQ